MRDFSFKMFHFSFKMQDLSFKMQDFSFKMQDCSFKMRNLALKCSVLALNDDFRFKILGCQGFKLGFTRPGFGRPGFEMLDFEARKGPLSRIRPKPDETGVFYIKNSPF